MSSNENPSELWRHSRQIHKHVEMQNRDKGGKNMEMHAHQWRESRCRDGCSRLNLIAEISPQDLSDDDIIKFITLGIPYGNFSVLYQKSWYIYIERKTLIN